MNTWDLLCLCALLLPMRPPVEDISFRLADGVVSYEAGGQQHIINVGRRCTDLWVAPNQSVIAFVAIERTRALRPSELARGEEPVIEQSSIYIAYRDRGYVPELIVAQPFIINGRSWSVLRHPRLSPNGGTLFFAIPYTMTTWRIVSLTFPSEYRMLQDATDYCVVWEGQYSGSLILQQRYMPEDRNQGVGYRCVLTTSSELLKILSSGCAPFLSFANRWSHDHGGTCH
jgi:hypothetical protein